MIWTITSGKFEMVNNVNIIFRAKCFIIIILSMVKENLVWTFEVEEKFILIRAFHFILFCDSFRNVLMVLLPLILPFDLVSVLERFVFIFWRAALSWSRNKTWRPIKTPAGHLFQSIYLKSIYQFAKTLIVQHFGVSVCFSFNISEFVD